MIVAKTRLKEKPKTCRQCIFRTIYQQNGEDICRITRAFCPWERKANGMFGLGKPDWCPLMDAEELSGNSGQLESLQRHGRWKRSGPLLECNQCGEIYSQLGGNSGKSWNYCPNCGVDMRGDGND